MENARLIDAAPDLLDALKAMLIIIGYFLLQSVLLALFATLIWQLILAAKFSVVLGYWHWFGIMMIIHLLRFDTVEKINNFDRMFRNSGTPPNNDEDEIH